MTASASLRAALQRRRDSVAVGSVAAVAEPAALRRAWRHVRANGGGAGGDGVTTAMFEAGLEANLAALSRDLAGGAYHPGPLRRLGLRKPDGRQRLLRIPCIRDRVAQTSALGVLHPALDHRQSKASFGYRPALGVAQALAAVRAAQAEGLVWTWEADIAEFFDRVPHRRLLQELAIWIEADDMLSLIATWLRGFGVDRTGLAQGAPISPLLANLYLHPLDRLLLAAGHRPVRYADDFVVLARCRTDAERARDLATRTLRDRGLVLQPRKTRIVPPGEGFAFLGETLVAGGAAA